MQKTLLLLTIAIISFSCTFTPGKESDQTTPKTDPEIPENAIPFVYNGYILVPISIDGVDGNFIMDTGSEQQGIDSVFYSTGKLSYENLKNYTATGIGNSRLNIMVIEDTVDLSLGNRSLKTIFIPIYNLKTTGGDFIDGIVGTKYFLGYVLQLNYPDRYAIISESLDSTAILGYNKVPLIKIKDWYCVHLKVQINSETTIEGNFLIDTGMPETTITSSAAKTHNLSANISPKIRFYTKYGGLGGESSSFEFIADSLQLAGHSLGNVNFSYSLDQSGVLADNAFLGIIGNNVLDRFDLMFDFINSYLYVKPNETFHKPYVFDRLGFSFVDRTETLGAWVVTGMAEDGPAEKQGLRIDDRIISVNTIPTKNISYKELHGYFDLMDDLTLVVEAQNGTKTVHYKLSPLL